MAKAFRGPQRAAAPLPLLPAFSGPCLCNVLAALSPGSTPPAWAPALVEGASQVVLLVLDGLGWEQMDERRSSLPTLATGTGGAITSVAPSTTATALTSLTTGLPPAVHGVVGYRVAVDGRILNVLRWTIDGGDARQRVRPGAFQRHPALVKAGPSVAVVTRGDYAPTGFTAAHLGRAPLRGWQTVSGLPVEVRRFLKEGTRFVYAYYDGVDRVAHVHGLDEHYEREVEAADRLVADMLEVLPAGAALVVTADHGQVEVGPRVEVLGPELMDGVARISGEGRFRWLHARPGAADDLVAAAKEAYGESTWVRTFDEIVQEGWLGGEPSPDLRSRLGDVALVPFAPIAFLDPADTGEQRLAARHGSLTEPEMLVPLLGWRQG